MHDCSGKARQQDSGGVTRTRLVGGVCVQVLDHGGTIVGHTRWCGHSVNEQTNQTTTIISRTINLAAKLNSS